MGKLRRSKRRADDKLPRSVAKIEQEERASARITAATQGVYAPSAAPAGSGAPPSPARTAIAVQKQALQDAARLASS